MPLRLLVVDDDPHICKMLTMLFEGEGWSTDCAANTPAANAAIEKNCYDVIVTDLRMEDPDSGIDVAICARECALPPAIVILSAARLERHQWQRFADAYVQKGTDARKLVKVIADLGRSHAA
jgi:two-component system response regulator HydG